MRVPRGELKLMIFSGLLQRFRKKRDEPGAGDAERVFALRHHSFKLFLKSWNKFQETMTEVEYTLCCDHPCVKKPSSYARKSLPRVRR